ncbi:cobalt-zinc-cadmium resistance protein CzcC precursor [bacterium BMS3Abin05]|nr:cobalt-zinc-cadmium resistance protein CzcC precursor [bacterium BMS3Abin05]
MTTIMRRKAGLLIMFMGIVPFVAAQEGPNLKRISLERFIQMGLQNNPGLKSAKYSVDAGRSKIPQAGALPDPVLSVNLMNLPVNTFVFDQEPMTGKQFALMQKIPFSGKLGLKKEIARESFERQKFRLKELENQLKLAIKKTYFSLFAVDQTLIVTEKNMQLLQQFERIAETRYAVGKGLQQDVLKAQVERSKLLDQKISLRQKRRSLQAKLNSLVNRPAGKPIGKIRSIRMDSLSENRQNLKKLVIKNRPFLKMLRAQIRQSGEMIRLARKNFLPDFSLGIAYTQRNRLRNGMPGVDYVSAMVSVNLPVYFPKKQSKKLEETRLQKRSIEESYQNALNNIDFQIENTLALMEKNKRRLALLKTGIIPQASQSLNAALMGYQVGKVDFLTLLNNQRTLFSYEIQYDQVLADFEKNLAELEAIVGKKLF